MPRLTKAVREKMLQQNEGASFHTNFDDGKNIKESRTYTISDGKLYIREQGKTSWADSRYDNTRIADEEEVHRFLYKHQDELDYEE